MNRLGIVVWVLCVLLASCALVDEDQAGVTSTGNSGEVAGLVYRENNDSSASLLRLSVAASSKAVDSALVRLLNGKGQVVDSTWTNVLGAFRFLSVKAGTWSLQALVDEDTIEASVVVTAGEVSRVGLVAGGESGVIPSLFPQSLYQASSGRDSVVVYLRATIDSQSQVIHVERDSLNYCLLSTGKTATADWTYSVSSPYLSLASGSCPQLQFFSTLTTQIADNNWFYNGDLRELDTMDLASGCEDVLALLPEILQLGMSSLTLYWDAEGGIRAVFQSDDWCFIDSIQWGFSRTGATVNCRQESITQGALEWMAYSVFDQAGFALVHQGDGECLWRKGSALNADLCRNEDWPADCGAEVVP